MRQQSAASGIASFTYAAGGQPGQCGPPDAARDPHALGDLHGSGRGGASAAPLREAGEKRNVGKEGTWGFLLKGRLLGFLPQKHMGVGQN